MDAVYDQLSGYGPDHDYWVRLVGDVEAGDLCDLGCGTGMLSVLFARGGQGLGARAAALKINDPSCSPGAPAGVPPSAPPRAPGRRW